MGKVILKVSEKSYYTKQSKKKSLTIRKVIRLIQYLENREVKKCTRLGLKTTYISRN